MEKLKFGIRPAENKAIFHDSRGDVRKLGDALQKVIDKTNELVDAVNEIEQLRAENAALKRKLADAQQLTDGLRGQGQGYNF